MPESSKGSSTAVRKLQRRKVGRPRRRRPLVCLRKKAEDPLSAASFDDHYKISNYRRNNADISAWIHSHGDDPAFVASTNALGSPKIINSNLL